MATCFRIWDQLDSNSRDSAFPAVPAKKREISPPKGSLLEKRPRSRSSQDRIDRHSSCSLVRRSVIDDDDRDNYYIMDNYFPRASESALANG